MKLSFLFLFRFLDTRLNLERLTQNSKLKIEKISFKFILSVKSMPQAATTVTASEPSVQKSPKTSHKTHESTVQRITKAIRGSGRSDSKSKKKDGREARYGY